MINLPPRSMRDEQIIIHALPPAPPAPGTVLITRRPRSNAITITYDDGQSELVYRSMEDKIPLLCAQRFLPEDKVRRAIDYVWNFGSAYVSAPNAKSPPPKDPMANT